MRYIIALFILLLPLQFAHAQDGRVVKVTASFSILADAIKKIGGSRVKVTSIVPPGSDVHGFEARPSDSTLLKDAELLVTQGAGFDDFAGKLANSSNFRGARVIASTGIKLRAAKTDHDHGASDPHTWQNPMHMIITGRNIASALTKIDPAGAAVYEANLMSFSNEMRALDQFARTQFDKIPAARRVIITTHDSFGYLGDAYGIHIIPALGISTINDNSAQNMAMLIDQARQSNTRAIFLENISNPQILGVIAKELGAAPAGKLYSDSLSKEGPAATYGDMFRYNVMQITAAMSK